jgi:hypothetical protein
VFAPIADSSSARLWKPYHKVRGARRRHSGGPRVAIDVEGLGPKSRSPPALALDFLPDSQPLFAFGREGLLAGWCRKDIRTVIGPRFVFRTISRA